jgi:hypothetical protein
MTASDHAVSHLAYSSLVKATWILIDVIADHPQLSFLDSNGYYEVKLLSAVSYFRKYSRANKLEADVF